MYSSCAALRRLFDQKLHKLERFAMFTFQHTQSNSSEMPRRKDSTNHSTTDKKIAIYRNQRMFQRQRATNSTSNSPLQEGTPFQAAEHSARSTFLFQMAYANLKLWSRSKRAFAPANNKERRVGKGTNNAKEGRRMVQHKRHTERQGGMDHQERIVDENLHRLIYPNSNPYDFEYN